MKGKEKILDDKGNLVGLGKKIKEKLEASKKFKWYLARVEKEIGKILKCLRSYRGGKFISNEFKNFFIERGIKR